MMTLLDKRAQTTTNIFDLTIATGCAMAIERRQTLLQESLKTWRENLIRRNLFARITDFA